MLLISWTPIALQLESWFILKQYFTLYNPVKSERTHITAGKIKYNKNDWQPVTNTDDLTNTKIIVRKLSFLFPFSAQGKKIAVT